MDLAGTNILLENCTILDTIFNLFPCPLDPRTTLNILSEFYTRHTLRLCYVPWRSAMSADSVNPVLQPQTPPRDPDIERAILEEIKITPPNNGVAAFTRYTGDIRYPHLLLGGPRSPESV